MRIDFAAIRARTQRTLPAFAAVAAAEAFTALAGWVKCPRSGVAYHPAYDVGCGRCKPCVDAAEAVESYKKGDRE